MCLITRGAVLAALGAIVLTAGCAKTSVPEVALPFGAVDSEVWAHSLESLVLPLNAVLSGTSMRVRLDVIEHVLERANERGARVIARFFLPVSLDETDTPLPHAHSLPSLEDATAVMRELAVRFDGDERLAYIEPGMIGPFGLPTALSSDNELGVWAGYVSEVQLAWRRTPVLVPLSMLMVSLSANSTAVCGFRAVRGTSQQVPLLLDLHDGCASMHPPDGPTCTDESCPDVSNSSGFLPTIGVEITSPLGDIDSLRRELSRARPAAEIMFVPGASLEHAKAWEEAWQDSCKRGDVLFCDPFKLPRPHNLTDAAEEIAPPLDEFSLHGTPAGAPSVPATHPQLQAGSKVGISDNGTPIGQVVLFPQDSSIENTQLSHSSNASLVPPIEQHDESEFNLRRDAARVAFAVLLCTFGCIGAWVAVVKRRPADVTAPASTTPPGPRSRRPVSRTPHRVLKLTRVFTPVSLSEVARQSERSGSESRERRETVS